ncbi:MAG: PKD domain-containing protein [bacterium]|nr:PKD domain-containing protein [bacterium]
MKKITTYLKTLALAALIIGSFNARSQVCVASFVSSNMANGLVTFTSTSAPVTSLTTYYWTFGNNTTFSATGTAGMFPTCTYTANGTYSVTLFIMSIPTCSSGITVVVTVTNTSGCALNANFNYTQGSNGLVNFNNTTTGIIGTTYSWNYGDNNTLGTAFAAPHTYSANGAYTVTLIATNNPTCTSTKTLVVNVTSYCNVNASFSATQGLNGVVGFISTSTGTLAGYVYTWSFGDGNTTTFGPSITHNYINGTYFVTLTVKNNSISPTCQDTAAMTLVITSNTCNISANFTHSVAPLGLVNFYNTSTGTTSSTTYTWNFGNGFTSNTANPSITYLSGGIYNVTLIARNSASCTSAISKTIAVTTASCVANANFSLVPTGTPQYWNAIPASPWNVSNATWSWGDGTSTNFSLYAAHQYTASNMYTICLTVTASCGATATACNSYSVYRTSEAMSIININVVPPTLQNLDGTTTTGLANSSIAATELNVFPNPNTGAFHVQLDGASSAKALISVYNLVGDLLYQAEADHADGQLFKNVNIPGITNGIYFVTLKNENQTLTRKIIVNN